MAETHEHVYVLKAEFDGLIKELDDLKKKFGAAEAAAKKLKEKKEAAAKSGKKLEDGLKGTAKALTGFGGTTGSVVGMLQNFTEGLVQASSAVGPVGLALGGTALAAAAAGFALVGTAAAMKGMSDAAVEARDRLIAAGEHYGIPEEDLDSIRNYEYATKQLGVEVDKLTVSVGAGLAGELGVLSAVMSDFAAQTSEAAQPVQEVEVNTGALAQNLSAMGLSGLAGAVAMYDVYFATTDAARGTLDAAAAADEAEAAYVALGMVVPDAEHHASQLARAKREEAEAVREAAKAQREAEKQARDYQKALTEGAAEINEGYKLRADRIKEQEDANKALAAIIDQANATHLTDQEKIQKTYDDRIKQIGELTLAASDDDAERAAYAAAEAERVQSLSKLWDDHWKDFAENAQEAADVGRAAIKQMEEEAAEDMKVARETLATGLGEAASDIAETISTIAIANAESIKEERDSFRDAIKDRRTKLKELEKQEAAARQAGNTALADRLAGEIHNHEVAISLAKVRKDEKDAELKQAHKAVVAGFRMEQAAALGEVAINAGIASIALLGALAPLGPGAPVAVAAIVVPMVAASTASILAQKPPKLHDGGMGPDEFSFGGATVRKGESFAVFNQRATETGEAVAAANRGLGSGPVILQLMDSGQVIGEAFLIALQDKGPTGRAIRSALKEA